MRPCGIRRRTNPVLDANENPFETGVNRYPDPFQQKLKKRLADLRRVSTDQLVLGNGSDELIDLVDPDSLRTRERSGNPF